MSILNKVNEYRRVAMRGLTKNIGKSNIGQLKTAATPEIKRVLICRPNNRLGNLLLMTPLIQEVSETFPGCTIDLFVRGTAAPIIFEGYKNVNQIISLPKKPFKHLLDYASAFLSVRKYPYDIAINVIHNSSSGRLSVQLSNSKYKIFTDGNEEILAQKFKDYRHMAKYPVYNFREDLLKIGFPEKQNPVPLMDLKLSHTELKNGQQVLQDIVKNDKQTIGIFTYATGAKCYNESWWMPFYERLKTEFPNYNIIEILPVENVSQINFSAPSFYSKDIREIGSVIANTKLFIGADSGMMHLASASLTTTVGLFSVTESERYAPYGNNSTAIDTNKGDINQWISVVNLVLKGN